MGTRMYLSGRSASKDIPRIDQISKPLKGDVEILCRLAERFKQYMDSLQLRAKKSTSEIISIMTRTSMSVALCFGAFKLQGYVHGPVLSKIWTLSWDVR
jgi:hypothetical protein